MASSNAQLVTKVVDLRERYERPVATWQQARALLDLPLASTKAVPD